LVLACAGGLAAWLTHSPPTFATGAGLELAQNQQPAPEAPPTIEPAPAPKPVEPDVKPVDPTPQPSEPPAPPKVDPRPTPIELPPALKIRPDTLFDAFEDTGTGRRKYGGKMVEISGPVTIGKDLDGRAYLGLVVVPKRKFTPEQLEKLAPRQRAWEEKGYPPNIRIYFDSKLADLVAAMPSGATATVRGAVRDRRDDADIYMGYYVIVDAVDIRKKD
jgi:hypothetical protein